MKDLLIHRLTFLKTLINTFLYTYIQYISITDILNTLSEVFQSTFSNYIFVHIFLLIFVYMFLHMFLHIFLDTLLHRINVKFAQIIR